MRFIDSETRKIGTHTCRKTGYLFAVWGIEETHIKFREVQMNCKQSCKLMAAARHATDAQAMVYKKDAHLLLDIASNSNHGISLIIAVWKPIYLENIQLARTLNTRNRACKSLVYHASRFIDICQPMSGSILDLLSACMQFKYALSRKGAFFIFSLIRRID